MGKFLMRLKYCKLEECNIVEALEDQEKLDKNFMSMLMGDVVKFGAILSLRPKIVSSSIICLQRVRDAYVKAMHRFAGRVMQLNNGNNGNSFKKVSWSP